MYRFFYSLSVPYLRQILYNRRTAASAPRSCTIVGMQLRRYYRRLTPPPPVPEPRTIRHRARGVKELASKPARRLATIHPLVCFYCGRTPEEAGRLTADHVIPRARGGTSRLENQVLACKRCNGRKGMMMPEEFRRLLVEELM